MEAERPTLDTVAKAAGVSRMTVSNAYNRPDQLSAATRERVLQVAAELGYGGPDPAGRTLRRGRSGTIGVVLSDHLSRAFSDPGMVANLHGLATALGEARLALLLLPVTDTATSSSSATRSSTGSCSWGWPPAHPSSTWCSAAGSPSSPRGACG